MEDVLRLYIMMQYGLNGLVGVFIDYMLPMPLTWFNHARPEASNGRRFTSTFFSFLLFFPLEVFFAFANFRLLYWPFLTVPKGWSGPHSMWSFGRHLSIPVSLLLLVSSFSFGFIVCFALVFFSSILRVSFGIYTAVECGTGISTAYCAG